MTARIVSGVLAHPDWKEAAIYSVKPVLLLEPKYIEMLIGMVGTADPFTMDFPYAFDGAHEYESSGSYAGVTVATRNVPAWLAGNQHVRFGGRVSFGWLSNDFGADGHIGDPTAATAERGKELFEGAVRGLGDALAEVAAFQLPV